MKEKENLEERRGLQSPFDQYRVIEPERNKFYIQTKVRSKGGWFKKDTEEWYTLDRRGGLRINTIKLYAYSSPSIRSAIFDGDLFSPYGSLEDARRAITELIEYEVTKIYPAI